jgi:hypothetical protein
MLNGLIAAMDTPAFWVFVVPVAGLFGVLVLTLVHRVIDWRHPQ